MQPPQISILSEHHNHEITVDVSERIWMLLGNSVHEILERSNEGFEKTLTEERMYADVLGWRISGQTDAISLDDNVLKDYKITSVYTIINALKNDKPEYVQQLNCYAWLARQQGQKIDKLNIIAIARDWSKFGHQRSPDSYPPSPVTVINIPMWTEDEQRKFIEERVLLHQLAEGEFLINKKLPKCSDAERWVKEDTYRILKKGRKSALRVLFNQKDADEYKESHKDSKNLSIEILKGKAIRCESYCSVAQFCNQYKGESS